MSLFSPAITRQSVTPMTMCTALRNDKDFILAGTGVELLFETGGVTSQAYEYGVVTTPTTAPATDINDYTSTQGHLLDIFAVSSGAGIEIRIDFGVPTFGTGSAFWRVLTVALTPGVPSIVNAFRLNTYFCRYTLFNTSAGDLNVENSVAVRSL